MEISQQTADRLIAAVAQGDMKALETLYSAMYRDICGYLLAAVGNPQAAEDLAQDTFLRVYKYAPHFVPSGCGKSWIYKIASRLALTYYQKNGCPPAELGDELPSRDNCEERVLDAQAVRTALQWLPEEERRIVSLHAVSGLTLAEIADLLGKPLGTVKWKHARAVRRLRELLGDDFT